jgi:broad specificity phosphatase PhoE
MAILLLIRHGENDFVLQKRMPGRLPGIHLNEKGLSQAQAAADFLDKKPIKAIYASPMERAVETAQPLARALNLSIQIHEGLNELNCGEWQGKTFKQLKRLKAWKVVEENPTLALFPGGDTFLETQQHVSTALLDIQSAYGEKDLVACFSHCDTIRLAIAFFLSMPLNEFRRVAVDVGSITTLYLGKEKPYLMNLNIRPGNPDSPTGR